jgi:hypothetical protein
LSRSRKIKILTAGIHEVFRGLKFLVDADIGKKGLFRSGTIYKESIIKKASLDSFKRSWQQAISGDTSPVSELWEGIDVE